MVSAAYLEIFILKVARLNPSSRPEILPIMAGSKTFFLNRGGGVAYDESPSGLYRETARHPGQF